MLCTGYKPQGGAGLFHVQAVWVDGGYEQCPHVTTQTITTEHTQNVHRNNFLERKNFNICNISYPKDEEIPLVMSQVTTTHAYHTADKTPTYAMLKCPLRANSPKDRGQKTVLKRHLQQLFVDIALIIQRCNHSLEQHERGINVLSLQQHGSLVLCLTDAFEARQIQQL